MSIPTAKRRRDLELLTGAAPQLMGSQFVASIDQSTRVAILESCAVRVWTRRAWDFAPRPHTDAFAAKKDAMRCMQPKKVKKRSRHCSKLCCSPKLKFEGGPRQLCIGCVGHAAEV